jgi:hypothetical protein
MFVASIKSWDAAMTIKIANPIWSGASGVRSADVRRARLPTRPQRSVAAGSGTGGSRSQRSLVVITLVSVVTTRLEGDLDYRVRYDAVDRHPSKDAGTTVDERSAATLQSTGLSPLVLRSMLDEDKDRPRTDKLPTAVNSTREFGERGRKEDEPQRSAQRDPGGVS